MVACFKCGAAPNHPIPSLDVLKLIQCSECGNISCVQHRIGILGGKCPKCNSSRSFIVAMRSGGKKKGTSNAKTSTSISSGGGGGASGGSIPGDSGGVSLSQKQLKEMQQNRIEAEKEAKRRRELFENETKQRSLSKEEQKRANAAEKAVLELLGTRSLIQSAVASEEIKKKKKTDGDDEQGDELQSVSLEGSEGKATGAEGDGAKGGSTSIGVSTSSQGVDGGLTTISSIMATTVATIPKKSDKKESCGTNGNSVALGISSESKTISNGATTISSEMINSMAGAADVDENSFLTTISSNMATAVAAIPKKSDDEEGDGNGKGKDKKDKENKSVEKAEKTKVKKGHKACYIKTTDSFYVKTDGIINIEEQSKKNEEDCNVLSESLEEICNKENIDISLRTNYFVPLDSIDKLLNANSTDLKDAGISIITGILGQKLNVDSELFLEQFALMLHNKDFISGIYTSFAENDKYNDDEQKEINLKLLEIAQENNKTVYLGLENKPIKLWSDIFDEYDLTEINFVYTDLIKDEETLNFVKENNISILIRPDIDYQFYAEIISSYNNVCLGSSFGKNITSEIGENNSNSIVLAEIVKKMADIDKNNINLLLNMPESD